MLLTSIKKIIMMEEQMRKLFERKFGNDVDSFLCCNVE